MMPVPTVPAVIRRTGSIAMATLLLLGASACSDNAPAKTDLKASSIQGKYVVQIQPSNPPVAINQMHSWDLKLTNSKGEGISGAHFQIAGGMPQHNHGLPTQPMVTKDLGDGRYLIEGMKFSMTGWWEIRITVDAGKGTDMVTLNTIVPDSAANASAAAGK